MTRALSLCWQPASIYSHRPAGWAKLRRRRIVDFLLPSYCLLSHFYSVRLTLTLKPNIKWHFYLTYCKFFVHLELKMLNSSLKSAQCLRGGGAFDIWQLAGLCQPPVPSTFLLLFFYSFSYFYPNHLVFFQWQKNIYFIYITTVYQLVSSSHRVLVADRMVEMPQRCITSSHKSLGKGGAVRSCDITPDRVHMTTCSWRLSEEWTKTEALFSSAPYK